MRLLLCNSKIFPCREGGDNSRRQGIVIAEPELINHVISTVTV
jgi:hypothetical protein